MSRHCGCGFDSETHEPVLCNWHASLNPQGETLLNIHNVHGLAACEGRHCCIHNPSDHHMRTWPRVWRDDRGLMERMCPHGIGHPDPDHMTYVRSRLGDDADRGVHGCDGCCQPYGSRR